MKTKITYLLLILPLLTFAQGPWNFNTTGSVEGFVAGSTGVGQDATKFSSASILTQSGGDLKVEFAASQTKSPLISNGTAGIDADATVNFIEIRLKNLSQASYIRVGPNTSANYANAQISTGDSDYKTYLFDVTAWSGTSVGIDLFFKKYDATKVAGGNYIPAAAGEYILIDYIKPLAYVTTPEVNTFNFDATAEGFDKLTRATAVPATESGKGTLQVKSTVASALATVVGLNSTIAHVEGSNKYAHITLKNTTTNTQFQLKGKVATVATDFSPIQTYTVSDADYKTYDFDLTTWDTGYQFPELYFAVKNTWSATPTTYAINDIVVVSNTYYKSLTGDNTAADAAALKADTTNWVLCNATGEVAPAVGAVVGSLLDLTNSVYVDSIVFDNTAPALGTNNFGYANNTISLYPNPAQEVLNVRSTNKISKIEVYDLLGRKVASNNNASDVNVAALGKGAYIVKVAQENGSVIAKQFIKE